MIYTFYSYKGGVGRSMALANVAELLYYLGLKVLIVDWDLEAPGLERFFPAPMQSILAQPGLMDLLLNYKTQLAYPAPTSTTSTGFQLAKPYQYIVDLYPTSGEYDPFVTPAGRLWLLSAGRREGEQFAQYGYAVRTFDWQDFYEHWEGELYFEWLRQQFQQIADVVLIDSRTGVTEMGGVSTYQLADVVVMFCAGNEQNIDGTRRMAENFTRPQVAEIRQNRPLHVLVVPARVDRAQNDLQNEFLIQFFTDFQDYLPSEAESLQKYRIPYVPLYSYKEVVAVREKDEHRVPDMVDAFAELVKFMAQFAPAESILPLAISRLGLALSKGGPLTPAELRGGDVGSAPESGSLTSAQRQQLQRALVSGFPNKDELIQVVSVGLDQEAMLSNVQTNALDLAATAIEQAEKHGRVEDLVIAALAANPDHQNLRLVALQLGHRTRVAAQRAAESWKVPTTAIPEPPDPGLRPNAESIERFRRQAGLSTGIARFIFGKAETE